MFYSLSFYFDKPTNDITTAIVFGASVLDNKEPSQVLKNRLDKAAELYENGNVKYILVTGDNRDKYYNEPKVMQDYLVNKGVPETQIYQDPLGLRTNDSCWRAKNVFGVQKAYLVTQNFHMPRAMFLCSNFGIESYKAVAENSGLQSTRESWLREFAAAWLAIRDIKNPGVNVNINNDQNKIPQ